MFCSDKIVYVIQKEPKLPSLDILFLSLRRWSDKMWKIWNIAIGMHKKCPLKWSKAQGKTVMQLGS